MDEKTQEGYLVLADISGYTSFLAQAELDHAREIITEVLELITGQFQPLLTISKLEGDAVFAYAPAQGISRGETLLDALESTYVAFRHRIQTSKRLTTCSCRACKAMPTLDLKFIIHYGHYAFQEVAGHRDVVGQDVVLVHRLLKNRVAEVSGWKAYTLFTRRALEQMNLLSDDMAFLQESYEHIGTVDTFSADLRKRYDVLRAVRQVILGPENAHMVTQVDLPASPVVVWDWLNDPQKRLQWSGLEIRPMLRPGGRLKEGAQNHCIHGKEVIVEEILDWRPFDYFTVSRAASLGKIVNTLALVPNGETTLLIDYARFEPKWRPLKPFGKLITTMIYKAFKIGDHYQALKEQIAAAQHSGGGNGDGPARRPLR
jgi:hypothetical protein